MQRKMIKKYHLWLSYKLYNVSIQGVYANSTHFYSISRFVTKICTLRVNTPHCDGPFGIDFWIFEKRSQNTPKDFRNIIYYHIWEKKSPIPMKSRPKVTKVDPKNTKKRPIYVVKLLCAKVSYF